MHNISERNVMIFGNKGLSETMLNYIRDSGWAVSLAYEVDDACRLIQDKNIYVGLAELDGSFSGNGIQPIEELVVRANHVQWLGAISRENVGSTRIKQVISSSFYDYHTLPYEPQRLVSSLGHAYGMAKMYLDDITLSRLDDLEFGEDEMVGASPQLQNVFSTIRKVAIVPAPVLITGESGTGKELTAKAIHERSQFASGPFIAVNCGAIPPSLIQSELFGYEKGSFTGADERKIGYLEAAHGGTIFLDEIGDLPLEQQINLLRFLQEKTIQRVGGTKHIHVEVRVISATHVDLERAVSDRRLREDLYYRLNVLQVKMPSLRNRDGDIELLAKYFFNKFSGEKNKNVKGFSKSCLNPMASYPWQGNVRELINRVRRGMVMCENKLISAHDLGIENSSSTGLQLLSLKHARERAEEEAIRLAVERSSKNMSLAARFLGISRVTLYRLLEKYNICDK